MSDVLIVAAPRRTLTPTRQAAPIRAEETMRPHCILALCATLFTIAAATPGLAADSLKSVTVSAGNADRRDAIVPVTLPQDSGPGTWTLRDDAGQATPLQVGPTGRGRVIPGA